jgi:hypothetical protein
MGRIPNFQPENQSAISDLRSTLPSPNDAYTTSNTPGDTTFSINSPPPIPEHTHKKIFIVLLIVVLLLLSSSAAFAYKAFYLDALTAPRDLYLNTLDDKSGKFRLTASVGSNSSSSLSELGRISLTSSGSYNTSDVRNPKLDINLKGSIGLSKFAGEILETE